MGWFGLGGGNDQNDPLANVEVPKDQLPPEVQKPASAKDIQRSNVAANVGQFDELAHGNSGLFFFVFLNLCFFKKNFLKFSLKMLWFKSY